MLALFAPVVKGFLIAAGTIAIGYIFGAGFAYALKHSGVMPIRVDFHANLLASEEAQEELDEMNDSGVNLPDHLKGYHQHNG